MITPSYNLTATQTVSPRLALDFTTATLDPRVTLTRADATATRFNSSGYIETVAADAPRFDFDPVTLACRGLLVEEQRTNIYTWSNDFSNVAWGPVTAGSVVDSTTAITPAGTNDAFYLRQVNSGTTHWLRRTTSTAYTSGLVYNQSAFLKYSGRQYIGLVLFSSRFGANQIGVFDLINGTVLRTEGGATASIVPAGNGWYRCSLTSVPCTSSGNSGSDIRMYSDDGLSATYTAANDTDGVYIYGFQLEVGAFPTSYIPTTTTALTRNADVATMTGTNFSDWFNASEGTFVSLINTANTASSTDTIGNARGVGCVSDNTNSNRFRIGISLGGFTVVSDGATSALISGIGSISANADYNFACTYKANAFQAGKNGVLGTEDTSGAVPTGVNRLDLGVGGISGAGTLNGYLKNFMFYPLHMTNAETQAFSKG
jgi:hypothetical protein